MDTTTKILAILAVIILAAILIAANWSGIINSMMPADSRPGKIEFKAEPVTDAEFEKIASQLLAADPGGYDHIDRFRKAGIRAYEGPQTCLQCHAEIQIEDARTGAVKTVDLIENVTTSVHYRFYSMGHPDIYGFNGENADNFPMGKIDRPCPKPGSFAFTAWAELVELEDGTVLSEGCGQCHMGGQYQAPLGEIMPAYHTQQKEWEAIDCLICHAIDYDMNQKQVVVDDNGRARWDQDRSMLAMMSIDSPTSENCLRCHQHNFGGDIYVDSTGHEYFQSMLNKGHERPRIAHPGSKRGTPFSPAWDVHAAAGMECIECHTTEGHYIAKGTHTTTQLANDLVGVEVSCEKCHGSEPHSANEDLADFYNMHTEKIACQTCHIPNLQPDNATIRDFATPEFEEHPGIYVYTDHEKLVDGHDGGIMYRWWNGDGSFLGNAIGDNPNGENLYRFYKPEHVWPEFADFDYEGWYEKVMRPIAKQKPSKLYAMKRFNGRQHIDLENITPFGGMYVPYNLPTYYTTGDPKEAGKKELHKSMMGMMYGFMFKTYLMDTFMSFMDADGWHDSHFAELQQGQHMEARYIPQDASMEISHAIRRDGALSCDQCHSPDGVLDWAELGYPEDEVEMYQMNPLE